MDYGKGVPKKYLGSSNFFAFFVGSTWIMGMMSKNMT